MTLQIFNPGTDATAADQHDAFVLPAGGVIAAIPKLAALRDARDGESVEIARWPKRMDRESFHRSAYPLMLLSRRLEDRLLELFQKGYVKGTVTSSAGNEATALGMTMPLRPGKDVVSLLHRDFVGHLLLGATPYQLICQYMANEQSPTHACEGNCHHGDAAARRFPMISHLGKMLSVVVGGTWAARNNGEQVFGLTVIGDGGTSTGEFHESLNIASVHKVPVLFVVENNHYAFSTPTAVQYNCRRLSDRAIGYGITGWSIDGLDPWTVYSAVCEAMEAMEDSPAPVLLECDTRRLGGHAAYDKGHYVPAELMEQWRQDDPLVLARHSVARFSGLSEQSIREIESAVDAEVREVTNQALAVARPRVPRHWPVHAEAAELADEAVVPVPAVHSPRRSDSTHNLQALSAKNVKNGDAVNMALDCILASHPSAYLAGMDVGAYGSAFKTCKGLIDRYGPSRVIDMPIAESSILGFALGSSQTGAEPIIEFQFADFSTEAVTQLGLNAGTWYFRTGCAAPMLLRLPCGGGMTMGAFHSGEFEGLWSRFPGLKLLYPATSQETYEALLAGFYDPNPCLVFEHKLLYWSRGGDIEFDGDLAKVWRPRRYTEGDDLTLVAIGAMVPAALAAVAQSGCSVEVWNPFVLQPLDIEPIAASVSKTGRLLVVQESGETQGLGDRLVSLLTRQCFRALKEAPLVVSSPDAPVPFAPELEAAYRPNQEKICAAITALLGTQRSRKVA